VEVVIADGADHVRHCSERFDLIVLDLPDPGGPCTQLYEPAFLRRCADLLTAGGRVSLHLGSAHADLPRLQRLHAGLASVFGTVRPFRVPIPLYGGEWLMAMCSPGPLPEASKQQIESGLQREGVAGLNYYNAEVHAASFALPNYLRRALEAEAAAAMQPAASAEVAA
jgi:spermidine synthase